MNSKYSRLKIPKSTILISLLLLFGYLVFTLFPYFFSKINRFNALGPLSVVDEKSISIQKTVAPNRTAGRFDVHLLKGEKLKGEFTASENSFGVLLVRFIRLSAKVSDTVEFRIKEKGKKKWYYENNYTADQFQPNEYFTFGLPSITNSRSKTYVFEVESLAGTYKNGVGLSLKKPQVALVYKYTKDDLKNFNTSSSFIYRKLIYAIRNANFLENWYLLVVSQLIFFLVVFMKENKVTVLDTLRFLRSIKKNRKIILKKITGTVVLSYLYYIDSEKKVIILLNKVTNWFSSTRFYSLFITTSVEKRTMIILLIFLIAFVYRFSATLVNQSNPWVGNYQTTFFYAGLGGQGDYDQLIRTATCALNLCPAILGQNMPFETPILGLHYKIFGFVKALKIYLYLMLILSSIVATIPYLIFSRKNWISLGGILGSLFLATSDFLTRVALNFPPDNGSLFTFSMFFIIYLLAINFKKARWLLFFGFSGFFDGMFKALFLINDLVVFVLFIPVFFFEKANLYMGKRKIVFISSIAQQLFQKRNVKILSLSLIPLMVFLTLYIALEVLTYIKFSASYFLRGILISNGSTFVPYTPLSDSSLSGNVIKEVLNTSILAIITVKHLIENTNLQIIFLAPIFIGMLFSSFIKAEQRGVVKKFVLFFIFSVFLIILMTIIKNDYYKIHEIFNGDYIYSWTEQIYVGIFLFMEIIALFILNFGYSAIRLSLPIIPYVVMLIIMAKNAPFARLQTHVVVWSIILLAYLVDWIMTNIKQYSTKVRTVLGLLIFALFSLLYMLTKTLTITTQLNSGLAFSRDEISYLKWVNKELPKNAVILAGGKSDLVTVAENIKKPIIYNSLWAHAILIKPNEIPVENPSYTSMVSGLKINEIPGIKPNYSTLVEELQNKDNFKINKYIILEDDIYIWRNRVAGIGDSLFSTSSATLHADNYSIKVYKLNPVLKRAIYELNIKDTSVNRL